MKGANNMKIEVYDKSTERLIESYSVKAELGEAKIDWINRQALQSGAYMVCDCVADADDGMTGLTYLSKVVLEQFQQLITPRSAEGLIKTYDVFVNMIKLGLEGMLEAEEVYQTISEEFDLSKLWMVQMRELSIVVFVVQGMHEVREKYYDIAYQYLTKDKLVKFTDEKETRQAGETCCSHYNTATPVANS